MKKSDVLKQERAAIESKINDLVEKATRNEAENAEFDTLRAEFEAKTREIEREEYVEKFQANRTAPVIHTNKTTPKDYSFRKAIYDMAYGGGLTGLEKEMHEEAKRHNSGIQGIGVPEMIINSRADLVAASSVVVATDTVDFIDSLKARLVVVQAGARVMTGLTGNLSIPRLTSGAAAWEGENDDANDFAASFDAVTMSPKRLAAYQALSKQLLIQSSYSVENLIRQDMINAIAVAVDDAAIEGGATGMPTGILNTSGIGSVICNAATGAGEAITFADIIALEKEVAIDNADINALAFLANPKVRAALKSTVVGTDQRMVWTDDNRLIGYPVYVTTQVPSDLTKGAATGLSAMIFGNFKDLMIGQWGGLDIIVDPYTAAGKAQVKIWTNSWWDVAVRHAQSFAALKDGVA